MARNKTLGSILDLYRSEADVSLNPAHNEQARDKQVKLLQRIYETLWEDHIWPHLRTYRDYPAQALQRYYDFSADFDVSRIEKIEVKFGGQWRSLRTAITACDYRRIDSDIAANGYPIEAWQLREDEQLEFWPIVDTNGDATTFEGYLRVWGIRALPAFVADADRCLLDDRIIALYAAGETIIARGKPGDKALGSLKLGKAEDRKTQLLGNLQPGKSTQLFVGKDCCDPRMRNANYTEGQAT